MVECRNDDSIYTIHQCVRSWDGDTESSVNKELINTNKLQQKHSKIKSGTLNSNTF